MLLTMAPSLAVPQCAAPAPKAATSAVRLARKHPTVALDEPHNIQLSACTIHMYLYRAEQSGKQPQGAAHQVAPEGCFLSHAIHQQAPQGAETPPANGTPQAGLAVLPSLHLHTRSCLARQAMAQLPYVLAAYLQ